MSCKEGPKGRAGGPWAHQEQCQEVQSHVFATHCMCRCGLGPAWKQDEGQGWESAQYVMGKAIGTEDLPHRQASLRCVSRRQFKTGSKGTRIQQKNKRYFGYSAWHMLLQGEMKSLEVCQEEVAVI